VFSEGATWQVDADATSDACDIVHVTGNITLDGECVPNFLNAAKRPVNRVWTIATYGGTVAGRMAAPQGCKVRVNEKKKTVELHSSEAGTLFMVR